MNCERGASLLKADCPGGSTPLLRADVPDRLSDRSHPTAGLPAVAPNYRRDELLVRAHRTGAIPPRNSPDVVGAFRLICAPSHLSYDDPVVYPGEAGKSHLHLFFGNRRADSNSTYQSLRSAGKSTCGALNRSAYWMPALMNARKVILPDYATVYYKRRPTADPECHTPTVECTGLPRGLRYVFGRSMNGGLPAGDKQDPVNFTCSKPTISSHDMQKVLQTCRDGAQFVAQIAANNCWDGTRLDSADHREHMTQAYFGRDGRQDCPAGHRFATPDFHFNVSWTMRPEMREARFSSDVMMNKRAGETLHADWFGAWDDVTLTAWLKNCIDGFRNASGGDLCQGQQMVGAAQPEYGWKNPRPVVEAPQPGKSVVLPQK